MPDTEGGPDLLRAATLADEILTGVAEDARRLIDAGHALCLATVLVGDDDASAMYVSMKQSESAKLGIPARDVRLPADTTQEQLESTLRELSDDPTVTSILVQYPLPAQLDYFAALVKLDPRKDVDGLHPINLGLLTAGETSGIVPCTPRGIVALLEHHDISFEQAHVVVVGRGNTVGRPLSILLGTRAFGYNATVTVCHSRTADLGSYVRAADVLVAAAGVHGLITDDMVHPALVVVLAGVSFVDGKAKSDLTDDALRSVAARTPITGGVGPMTRAFLFSNAIDNAKHQVAS